MFNLLIICCLLFTTNVNSWDGYHRQIDDELPAISWKECGISATKCVPNSTFKDPFVSSRIWGGQYANTGEYPWFAFLDKTFMDLVGNRLKRVKTSCGGSVINEWWVLTAAHCVRDINSDQSVVVLVGSVDKFGGRRHLIEQIIIHPKYLSAIVLSSKYRRRERLKKQIIDWELNGYQITEEFNNNFQEYYKLDSETTYSIAGMYFDIALLKVKNRIIPVFNETHYKINSICLPKSQIINDRNESIVSIGMGLSGDPSNSSLKDVSSNKLKEGILVMKAQCGKLNFHENATQIFCVDSGDKLQTKKDSLLHAGICNGDSGSPQHQQYGCQAVEIGISSFSLIELSSYCFHRSWLVRVSVNMKWIRSEILNHRNVDKVNKFVFNPKNTIKSSVFGIISDNRMKSNHLLIVSVITTAIIAVVICSALLWICAVILMTRIKIN